METEAQQLRPELVVVWVCGDEEEEEENVCRVEDYAGGGVVGYEGRAVEGGGHDGEEEGDEEESEESDEDAEEADEEEDEDEEEEEEE